MATICSLLCYLVERLLVVLMEQLLAHLRWRRQGRSREDGPRMVPFFKVCSSTTFLSPRELDR